MSRSSTSAPAARSATRVCAPRSGAARRRGFPVLILSQYVEQTYAAELLADGTGGVGYLLKDRVSDVATSSRRSAASPAAAWRSTPRPSRSSSPAAGDGPLRSSAPRERAVLALMAEGRTNPGSPTSSSHASGVEKHVASIFGKLGLPPAETAHRRVLAVVTWLGG